jgi:four helix bundle protein
MKIESKAEGGRMKAETDHGVPEDLRTRTMDFALRILRLCARLPNTPESWAIRKQLVKSGTSPGAHYREACGSRSNAEFISKIEGGTQELDETAYWLEILTHSKISDNEETKSLRGETEELMKIFIACARNAKACRQP